MPPPARNRVKDYEVRPKNEHAQSAPANFMHRVKYHMYNSQTFLCYTFHPVSPSLGISAFNVMITKQQCITSMHFVTLIRVL